LPLRRALFALGSAAAAALRATRNGPKTPSDGRATRETDSVLIVMGKCGARNTMGGTGSVLNLLRLLTFVGGTHGAGLHPSRRGLVVVAVGGVQFKYWQREIPQNKSSSSWRNLIKFRVPGPKRRRRRRALTSRKLLSGAGRAHHNHRQLASTDLYLFAAKDSRCFHFASGT
jgi:hypothetical protein